jgi:hypothetical protein
MGCLDCRRVQRLEGLAACYSEGAGPDWRGLALRLADELGDRLGRPRCWQAAGQCSEWGGSDKTRRVDRQLLEVRQVDLSGAYVVKPCNLGAFERAMHERVVHTQRCSELRLRDVCPANVSVRR